MSRKPFEPLDAYALRDNSPGFIVKKANAAIAQDKEYFEGRHFLSDRALRERDEALSQLRAENEKLRAELEAAVDHCAQKSKRIRELESKSTDTVCAFCGVRFDEPGTEMISAHVLECEKHPLKSHVASLEAKLAAAVGVIEFVDKELGRPRLVPDGRFPAPIVNASDACQKFLASLKEGGK